MTTVPESLRTRVVRHESDLSSWEGVFRAPHPRVAPHVLGTYQGWMESATSFPSRLEVPFPGVVLILDLGSGFRLVDPRSLHPEEAMDLASFVAGMSDSYVYVAARGPSRCIQVNFTPLGAHRLLGLPMDSLANRSVPLDQILGRTGRRLEERLAEAPTWEARFDLLDGFFAARLDAARPAAPGVAWAWEELRATGGCVEVGRLAQELGWSRKHLVARFRQQIGLAPKMVARVFRFHRVVERLRSARAPRWAEIAYDCGYYDQAHLIRDFGEFAGSTPTEYVHRLLPDSGGVIGG
jgi:AraC-like DNA-binding protein